ncbi:hypothetical protein GOODEAATRI_032293 [Goodea atripinnis]|uniref:Uncharacterized protein n=1 Tax=Goodea atripinnis TaxID=208336 RepID=A0ABV0NFI7_9TELE
MEGSLLVCRDAESPPDQVVALQTNCDSIAEGREILDLPRLPPGGRRDCCFALILPQNKFLLLLSDNPDDCKWDKDFKGCGMIKVTTCISFGALAGVEGNSGEELENRPICATVLQGVMSHPTLQRQQSLTPCITDREPLPDSSSDKDPGSPRVGGVTPPLSRVIERGGSFRDRQQGQFSG